MHGTGGCAGRIASGVWDGAAERVAAVRGPRRRRAVYATSLGIICLVAFVACYIPSRRRRGSIPSWRCAMNEFPD